MNAVASIDGFVVDTYTFDWNNNNGELFMEFGSLEPGMRIDNLAISTVPESTSLSLAALGMAMLGLVCWRRSRR